MHPKFHTADQVKEGVRQLERDLTTRTLSSVQEAKMIKDIENLKKTESKAARFTAIEPMIKEIRTEKNKIWNEVKSIKETEADIAKKIDTVRGEMDEQNKEKDGIKEQLDALQKEIDVIDGKIDKLYAEKREQSEEYWKSKYDHKLQKEEIMHIQWMQRQKQRVVDQESERQALVQEREAAIRDLPVPYFKEMSTCDALISICN